MAESWREIFLRLNMDVKASGKYLRISPRKIRFVVGAISGLTVGEALLALADIRKRGAGLVLGVVESAIANAKNNFNLNEADLYIKDILVGEGPRLKRVDKSHGARFDRGTIKKRMCHVEVVLGVSGKETEKVKGKKGKANRRAKENQPGADKRKKERKEEEHLKGKRKAKERMTLGRLEEKDIKMRHRRKSFGRS